MINMIMVVALLMPQDAQKQDVTDKVINALKEVGGAIGSTAEKLFPMAVEYTWASATASVLASAFLLLVAVLTAKLFAYGLKLTREYQTEGEGLACAILSAAVGLGSLIGCVTLFANSFPAMLAPEGATLMLLLERLK